MPRRIAAFLILVVCAIALIKFADTPDTLRPGPRPEGRIHKSAKDAESLFYGYRPCGSAPHTIGEICSIYANSIFKTAEFQRVCVTKISETDYMVSVVYRVKGPKPNMPEFLSSLAQKDIAKSKSRLELDWLVDVEKERIRPYNYLSQDCLNLFKEMQSLLGVGPEAEPGFGGPL